MVRLLLPTPKKCTFCFLASQLHCLLEIIPALVKKKSIERFHKTANKSASIHINQIPFSSNRLESISMIFHTRFEKDLASFSTDNSRISRFSTFYHIYNHKASSQNISITLKQISLKIHEHRGSHCRKKGPMNNFGRKTPSAENYCGK